MTDERSFAKSRWKRGHGSPPPARASDANIIVEATNIVDESAIGDWKHDAANSRADRCVDA